MKRAVSEEAGYRCAIPTCKGTSALEFAHIVPWSTVQEHTFDNLILLCAVDHTRFDRGEIPAKSMRAFKDNLALLRGRYSDSERRILEAFAIQDVPPAPGFGLPIPGGTSYTMMYLKKDGLVTVHPNTGISIGGLPPWELVVLTEKGRATVERMRNALLIEEAL